MEQCRTLSHSFLLPQGAVSTAGTWGAFFSGKEPAPHPGRKAPGRFDFALDPQRHKGRGPRPPPLETNPQRPGQQPESTVTATRFPTLMGRQSCHFLGSGPLYPPPAALSPLSPIPPRGTKGRDCGPSPLETPPGDEGRGRKNQPPRGRRARDEDKTGNGPGSA